MNFNYMHSKFKSDILISIRATVKTNLSVKGNDPYAQNRPERWSAFRVD